MLPATDERPSTAARASSRAARPARTGAWRRPACALLAVVVGLIGVVTGASPAHAETVLDVSSPVPLASPAAGSIPLVVRVKSDRLLQATISAGSLDDFGPGGFGPGGFGTSAVVQAIEVPGGSEKELVLVVPVSTYRGDLTAASRQFRVTITADGTEVARRGVSVPMEPWAETVGVLPALAERTDVPPSSPLLFEAGTAKLGPIPSSVLEAGSAALDSYGTIVAAADDLERMSPVARAGVLQWVSKGGHLVVDVDAGTGAAPIAGLPEAWQPGPGGWSFAGGGEVRVSGGAAERGRWSSFLGPTGSEGGIALQRVSRGQQVQVNGPVSMTLSLADAAGFRMPDFSVLLVGLGIYVVVVGPVLGLVLARSGRRMAFWVAVPLAATLVSAVVVVSGARMRVGADSAVSVVVESSPAGTDARATALVGSASGGELDVVFPQGWSSADSAAAEQDGCGGCSIHGGSAPNPVVPVVSGATESRAHVVLNPGEYRMVAARGPVATPPGIEVDAAVDDGVVVGSVRNAGSSPVRAVVAMVGLRAVSVGDLAAGERRDFRIDPAALRPALTPEAEFWDLTSPQSGNQRWGMAMPVGMPATTWDCFGPGCAVPLAQPMARITPAGVTNPVNGAAWVQYLSAAGGGIRSADQLTVVGWTEPTGSPVHLADRGPIERGSVAVVARSNPAVKGRLDSVGARIERVRGTDLRAKRSGLADLRVNGPLSRIVLPKAVDGRQIDPSTVEIVLPKLVSEAQVWVGNGWRRVARTDPGGIVVQLGGDALHAGVFYVRTPFTEEWAEPGDPHSGADAFSVRTRSPGTGATTAVAVERLTPEEVAEIAATEAARTATFAPDAPPRTAPGVGPPPSTTGAANGPSGTATP